jgi:hypothetical protein
LQEWLRLAGAREVTIPYAPTLARLADARAVRLRRDFGAVLNLISAHAILHQGTREHDEHGRIIASIADYAAAYELVNDIVSEGVQASVRQEIREAVEAVRALDIPNSQPVTYKRVGELLNLDKSAARRRCEVALKEGYLVNRQERRGQPAVLSVGDPLPPDVRVLPSPEDLSARISSGTTVPPCHRSAGLPKVDEGGLTDNGGGIDALLPTSPTAEEPMHGEPEPWQLSWLEAADNLIYDSDYC